MIHAGMWFSLGLVVGAILIMAIALLMSTGERETSATLVSKHHQHFRNPEEMHAMLQHRGERTVTVNSARVTGETDGFTDTREVLILMSEYAALLGVLESARALHDNLEWARHEGRHVSARAILELGRELKRWEKSFHV
ncbi:hypothetical protein [Alicyclobacillus sp. ALC3]|uniref:hypothetical protein n=1 Tax=Alicyclobacillus sp. ALC3 TaxID=2796143 RepID=UPI0023790DF3|nr:hypothetical protein [Alicyclobacillus sp. ALC3]WDL96913.1 hypothetical protein JC200_21980 [Alicyclobacillus sp. ALC3]